MQTNELNENDQKLLAFCYNRKRHLSEIARHIGIDVKNVSVRVDKLKKRGLIKIEYSPSGHKKYIKSIAGDKTKEYFVYLLEKLEKNNGEMPQDKFVSLIPFSFEEKNSYDKFITPLQLLSIPSHNSVAPG